MLSLILWTTLLVANFLFISAAVAWAARAVGSPRGHLRVALVATLIFSGLNLVLLFVSLAAGEPKTAAGIIAAALFWFVVQMGITFMVLRKAFKLSFGRTFAPLGVVLVMSALFLVLNLAVLKPYVSQTFVIPSASMSPTLEPGDRFFVNKRADPRRWDLVTYWNTPGWTNKRTIYCKRLIGLPGEQLRFDNGQLYINNQVQSAPAVLAGRLTANMPYGGSRYRDGETISLGPNEIFVIGDNVSNSADSRMSGPTNISEIVGVVDLQYWPLSKFGVKR
jgi:signal peptidase I